MCKGNTKKHMQVGSAKAYDTNLIYSRIVGLEASCQDMNLNAVLKYESIPTSMYTNKWRDAISDKYVNSEKHAQFLKSQEDMHPRQQVSSLMA